MHLFKDLHSLFGELLVKEGVEITPSVVKNIQDMGDRHKQVLVTLSKTDIFSDFKNVLDDGRYSTVFQPPIDKEEVARVAGNTKIENDLIVELNNIKGNLPYTYHHILIVAALSIKIALVYKREEYDINTISHCGFTHDIGKSRIPISLLNKATPLTREERAIIESHTVAGYILLNYYLKSDRKISSMAHLAHHEKLDGTGYPKGIARVDKYSQLISIVDILDALHAKRPYRTKVYSLRASLDYLHREAIQHRLNKDIVFTLIGIARKTKPRLKDLKISFAPREELPEEMTHDKFR